jgi:hypothetical protein
MTGLIDFAATAEDLLEIEPEDLGLILISLAHSARGRPDQLHLSNFTPSQFEMPLWNANVPGYQHQSRKEVGRAVAEAWQWLQTEGLIMPAPDQPNGFFCLTRRGERLKNGAMSKHISSAACCRLRTCSRCCWRRCGPCSSVGITS